MVVSCVLDIILAVATRENVQMANVLGERTRSLEECWMGERFTFCGKHRQNVDKQHTTGYLKSNDEHLICANLCEEKVPKYHPKAFCIYRVYTSEGLECSFHGFL